MFRHAGVLPASYLFEDAGLVPERGDLYLQLRMGLSPNNRSEDSRTGMPSLCATGIFSPCWAFARYQTLSIADTKYVARKITVTTKAAVNIRISFPPFCRYRCQSALVKARFEPNS